MQKTRVLGFTLAAAFGLIAPAWADDVCPDPAMKAAAKAQLAQAQALESAGKLQEAWTAVGKVNGDCADSDPVKKRIAKTLGAEAEKKGRLDEAIDWYQRAAADPETGRVIRKTAEARSDDMKTVVLAIDFFYSKGDKAQEQAMRDLATRNVDKQLAEEEKRFATALKDSHGLLQKAQDWTFYAQAGQDRVRARAQQRGDFFAKEDSRTALEKAISYYFVGGLDEKIKRVKAKASGLGKQAEAKGELEVAADFYRIADEDGKADTVARQADTAKQKAEESRKKTFKKDQADLEKALGF